MSFDHQGHIPLSLVWNFNQILRIFLGWILGFRRISTTPPPTSERNIQRERETRSPFKSFCVYNKEGCRQDAFLNAVFGRR